MKPGDKVMVKSNTLFELRGRYSLYAKLLERKVYTISAIEYVTNEITACELLEVNGYIFPAHWFVPYKGLNVLIERRNKCLK